MSFPNEFLCPINAELMRDPVIGSDGHTYERSAITQWLLSHSTSPLTRDRMTVDSLTPNIALRSQIDRLLGSSSKSSVPAFKNASLTVEAERYENMLHLRVKTTSAPTRQPIVLLGILDTSGSMGEEAGLPTDKEALGFTRLDLVKHAVRALASILADDDMFGLIAFSTTATVELRPTHMTAAGKRDLYSALDRIRPDGGTNIWEGVRQASLLANDPQFAESNVVAMLLTDGLPNNNPPRGILPSMQALKRGWSLHTFGFGYQLDSDLLAQIATWGSGIFGFIPDCSMVGTVIINFMATALATASKNTVLRIQDGDVVTTLNTGAIVYGQPRDFYIPVVSDTVLVDDVAVAVAAETPADYGRLLYTKALTNAISFAKAGNMMAATTELATFEVQQAPRANDAMKAYLRDIRSVKDGEGQIGMAPQHFTKWGEHYMRSYLSAQTLQQCMNFKDPGLQIYGGELFHTLQEAGDTAFVTLPAPKPSRKSFIQSASYVAPVSMAAYHNPSGGCFAPQCRVRMANGERKPIVNMCPGDIVWTPTGPAQVLALVTCGSAKRAQPMVQLGDLCITPWHPIVRSTIGFGPRDSVASSHPIVRSTIGFGPQSDEVASSPNKWIFPADLVPFQDRILSTVYNLVLTSGHIVDVEGYECITLAHGFKEPIAAHPYFGSSAILDDLMNCPGWDEGRPVFYNLVATHDPDTGLINGWRDD